MCINIYIYNILIFVKSKNVQINDNVIQINIFDNIYMIYNMEIRNISI